MQKLVDNLAKLMPMNESRHFAFLKESFINLLMGTVCNLLTRKQLQDISR